LSGEYLIFNVHFVLCHRGPHLNSQFGIENARRSPD
jgi:hypothetical protein